jgi:hypothetical protein
MPLNIICIGGFVRWIISKCKTKLGDEYQDNFPKVDYNSKAKKTTSDIYNQ